MTHYLRNPIFISILLSIFVTASSIFSGAVNWEVQFFITGMVYFLSGLFSSKIIIVKHFPKWLYSFIILTPFFLIYTLYALIFQKYFGYPIASIQVIGFFSGIWLNYLFKKKLKLLIMTVLYLLLLFAGSIIGIPNYTAYFNKENISFKEEIKKIVLIDKNNKEVILNTHQNKVIVLDFWNSACGICFKKFPDYNELYNYYKHRNDIEIYAVNLKLKNRNIDDLISFSERFKYDFPFLFTNDATAESVSEIFNIKGVPTLGIIGKNGRIRYSGSLITDERVFINNAYLEIDKALAE